MTKYTVFIKGSDKYWSVVCQTNCESYSKVFDSLKITPEKLKFKIETDCGDNSRLESLRFKFKNRKYIIIPNWTIK
jgi:hypothetical protein